MFTFETAKAAQASIDLTFPIDTGEVLQLRGRHKVYTGEILAITGSSSSGKSLLASVILGILPENAIVAGNVRYNGQKLTPGLQEKLRGTEMALVPQSIAYLDPLMKIGVQADGHKKPYPTEKRRL